MKRWLPFLLLALVAGCARFEPRPLSPADTAAQLEGRALDTPELKSFLERNLHHDVANWPLQSWDFETLALAAFYYHPSLDVARAQWAVAQGGEKTAAQRPNPTLNITPGYNSSTPVPSPWFPLTMLDLTLETFQSNNEGTLVDRQLLDKMSIVQDKYQQAMEGFLTLDDDRERHVLIIFADAVQDLIQYIYKRMEQG